ncbi:MAG: hypothetical protein KUA43_02865 [Hoeflea sp.]|uniref:hypothetical protein n=1 Tax=Hoeflea sp. TaxID=1940281 RepID=UPI001D258AAC|nr:hypothetical protein [Hoeflea sp.]MBU4529871.1 hypothetical protein [Alphaproteobacteria bacterium]MBU4547108.1 hypothetical protein [Alphaproteobacteria bacterium]MBU4548721.1 hypothetical protein [Alphaproteobacteria bacterium]MBV1722364.1 hypothetical protein [Hoeflea sp.]MBV1762480.1 hypothetical protein [Hoeflea sp.]
MTGSIEWIAVKSFKPAPLGAVGFLDNKAVVIAAFYDDADANQDGKIEGFGERVAAMIGLKGRVIADIAMEARVNPDIVRRDANFAQEAPRIWLSFAKGLLIQGVYQAYFARGVGMVGNGVAKKITGGMVKQLVVRKGFETVVRNAFMAAVR